MSHFTRISTKIVEKEYLTLALQDLGYTWVEGEVEISGYQGNRTRVEMKIPTKNPGYDIGFRKTKDSYEIVADWWGIRDIKQEQFLQKLTQRYAYHATVAKLEDQGFAVINQDTQLDGKVHLVLRRMV